MTVVRSGKSFIAPRSLEAKAIGNKAQAGTIQLKMGSATVPDRVSRSPADLPFGSKRPTKQFSGFAVECFGQRPKPVGESLFRLSAPRLAKVTIATANFPTEIANVGIGEADTAHTMPTNAELLTQDSNETPHFFRCCLAIAKA
jgi:hypothetical protein